MPAHVRQHPDRVRVPRDQPIALRHQLLEAGKPRAILIAPIGIERQFQPPLVVVVERLEELRRIRRVHEHRDLQARRRLPHRIELRIVELQPRAVGLLVGQAEALHDLADAERAGLDVGLELRGDLLARSGTDVAQVEPGEHHHLALVAARRDGVHRRLQSLARRGVGVDHEPEVQRSPSRRRRVFTSSTVMECGGWWWKSMTGNFAFGTGCCGTTSVDRGWYSRIFGCGNSGSRPSAGRGRIWPGGSCCAPTMPSETTPRVRSSWKRFVSYQKVFAASR